MEEESQNKRSNQSETPIIKMEEESQNKRPKKESQSAEVEEDVIDMLSEENGSNGEVRVEEDDDFTVDFWDEGDSDNETYEDFSTSRMVEINAWMYGAVVFPYEKERRCLDLRLCHKDQHHVDFPGLPIVEIFKVKMKLNKTYSTTPITGSLHGEIVTVPERFERHNPRPISYYWASPNQPDSIHLDADHDFAILPISGPEPRPPVCEGNFVSVNLALKINDKDIFPASGYGHVNPQLFGEDGCKAGLMCVPGHSHCGSRQFGPFIRRALIGIPSPETYAHMPSCDPVLMGAYYSVFDGAWATIEVEMMKKDVGRFYGLIVARPCVFYARFRLLTIQRDPKKKITIERGDDGKVDEKTRLIKLTRSVVAVPSYSSLIIGASLYVGDDETICHEKVAFPARGSGQETKSIFHEGAETLKVTVKWNSQA